jgi:cellobiose phosphorylase
MKHGAVNSGISGGDRTTDPLPYHFHERGITITRPDMPSAWINYLSNGRMHAFVSQAGGGFCWWKSHLLFRLTR